MTDEMKQALEARARAVLELLTEDPPMRVIPAHDTQPCATAIGRSGDNVYAESDGSVRVIPRGASVSMRVNHWPSVARICERYPLPVQS